MSVVILIQGREALPVWTLPYVSGNSLTADKLALIFTQKSPRYDGSLRTFTLDETVSPVDLSPKQWDRIALMIQVLGGALLVKQSMKDEHVETWYIESVKRLPANAFVWLDEFKPWFRGYQRRRLPVNPAYREPVSDEDEGNDEPYLLERPGEFEPDLCPLIPSEVRVQFNGAGSGTLIHRGNTVSGRNILSDEKAAELARKPELRREDVFRLLGKGKHERFPFADDCDIDERGIRAKPLYDAVRRTVNAEERAPLELNRLDLELAFPCSPAELLTWCERNAFGDLLLPSPFVAAVKATPYHQDPAKVPSPPRQESGTNSPPVSISSHFKASKQRDEYSECTVGQFFPQWAAYCGRTDDCPYEGFRTLMDSGVTVKAGAAGTYGELLKFDPADVRVAFIRARKIARKSGDDGLSHAMVEVQDYEEEGMPLADFWLSRDNVVQILKERNIRDFMWPADGLPHYLPPLDLPEDEEEDTTGFLYFSTAINRVLGLDDEADAALISDARTIRLEIISERGHKTWPVRILARRDRVRFRGMDQVFEYVHFAEFAEWAFRRGLPVAENLAEKHGDKLSEWLVRSLRLKAIEKLRGEYRAVSFATGEGLIERERRLAELDREEGEIKAWLNSGTTSIAPIASKATGKPLPISGLNTEPAAPQQKASQKPKRRQTEINRWLYDTWKTEGKPTGAPFFDALKKYRGQKGSPIVEWYQAGKHAGIKWQTSGGATGEWTRKAIQTLASEFRQEDKKSCQDP